jgi:pimeloyl-ACP methyl ester carboxylesterase
LEALHATESLAANQFYRGCTDPPYKALSHQDGLGVVPQIANLLDSNVPMLFYNGMKDLICNHVGNERALMNIPWSKAEQWRMAPRYTWQLGENMPPAAYVQEQDNLIFLKIPNSGHMLPMDQPELCLEMIRRFVYQIPFQSSPQELERGLVVEKAC